MAEKRTAEAAEVVSRFTKVQLMASSKYAGRKDLIGALLDEKETYTTSEVDALIENYMKGQVI